MIGRKKEVGFGWKGGDGYKFDDEEDENDRRKEKKGKEDGR
jgi:hypothetical protein